MILVASRYATLIHSHPPLPSARRPTMIGLCSHLRSFVAEMPHEAGGYLPVMLAEMPQMKIRQRQRWADSWLPPYFCLSSCTTKLERASHPTLNSQNFAAVHTIIVYIQLVNVCGGASCTLKSMFATAHSRHPSHNMLHVLSLFVG